MENVVVMMVDPVVVVQVKVMRVPHKGKAELYEQLLRLNGSDTVHGAYAIQGDDVVFVDTLEGDSMDLNEFQASLDAIGVALSQHYHILAKYRN
jgi:predicted house-cleaning NTP pyrophosphatase (Maf/HAM1 superfamily)